MARWVVRSRSLMLFVYLLCLLFDRMLDFDFMLDLKHAVSIS